MPAHLLLVHFPVALLTVGAAADLFGAATGREAARRFAGVLLVLGAAGAVAAVLTGQGALLAAAGRVHPGSPAIETHAQAGAALGWLLGGAGLLRAMWHRRLTGAAGWALLAVAVLSAAAAWWVASTGHAVSHAPAPFPGGT